MQKTLERMNIKIHDVISDLSGVSGMKIVRAIVAGQRDPQQLLQLCDVQIKKNKAERVLESLRGTWQAEHLFALRQALQGWRFLPTLESAPRWVGCQQGTGAQAGNHVLADDGARRGIRRARPQEIRSARCVERAACIAKARAQTRLAACALCSGKLMRLYMQIVMNNLLFGEVPGQSYCVIREAPHWYTGGKSTAATGQAGDGSGYGANS